MTNQEIAQLARDKGYAAKVVFDFIRHRYNQNLYEEDSFVKVWLTRRKVTLAEIERELDIPAEVMAYGPNFDSVRIWGIDS